MENKEGITVEICDLAQVCDQHCSVDYAKASNQNADK
jgi:hypothetical protein